MADASAEDYPLAELTGEFTEEYDVDSIIFRGIGILLVIALVIFGATMLANSSNGQAAYVHEDGTPLTAAEIADLEISPDKYVTLNHGNAKTAAAPATAAKSGPIGEATICGAGISAHLQLTSMPPHTGKSGLYQTFQTAAGSHYSCKVSGKRVIFFWNEGDALKFGRASFAVEGQKVTFTDGKGSRIWNLPAETKARI